MNQIIVILSTAPDEETAARIARALVEERLAACVNRVSPLRSVYRWKGGVVEEAETLLLVKTRADLYDRVEARLRELHPYEVPEVLAFPVSRGWRDYLAWVAEESGG